jgi:hypothetical protein
MTGPLLKQVQNYGTIGMNTMGKILKVGDSCASVSFRVLAVDSSGGTVDGTETLANIVKSLKIMLLILGMK